MIPAMYSAQWFMTIFSYGGEFDVTTRVWDAFLVEGYKVVFRVALYVLKMSERMSIFDVSHYITYV